MFIIDGYIIEYIDEFKEHFNLDKALPLVKDIIDTYELFENKECARFRPALAAVYAAKQPSFEVGETPDGGAGILVNGEVFAIAHTPKDSLTKAGALGKQDALALLLSELAARPFHFSQPESADAEDFATAKSQDIKRFPVISAGSGPLQVRQIHNPSDSGFAYVILENDKGDSLFYQLSAGNRMCMLLIGDSPINKIPQLSVSTTHVNYVKYKDQMHAAVCGIEFKSKRVLSEHTFDATKLTQVCSDERNGFVALVDGEILSFSDELQPEDIEDMTAYIPAKEKIVMIALTNRQIFALTDAKKVYSNFSVACSRQGKVVWMEKDANGDIAFAYEDSIPFPKNTNTQVCAGKSITYDNGNISE